VRRGHQIAAYLAAPLAVVAVLAAVSFVRHTTPAATLDPAASTPVDESSLPPLSSGIPSPDASDAPSTTPTKPPAASSPNGPTPKPAPTTHPVTGPSVLKVTATSTKVTVDQWIDGGIRVCVPATVTITNEGGGEITQVRIDARLQAVFASGGSPVDLEQDWPPVTLTVSVRAGHPATRAVQLCGLWEAPSGNVYIEWKGTAYLVGGFVDTAAPGATMFPTTKLIVI
jgi:hypothetical protein